MTSVHASGIVREGVSTRKPLKALRSYSFNQPISPLCWRAIEEVLELYFFPFPLQGFKDLTYPDRVLLCIFFFFFFFCLFLCFLVLFLEMERDQKLTMWPCINCLIPLSFCKVFSVLRTIMVASRRVFERVLWESLRKALSTVPRT